MGKTQSANKKCSAISTIMTILWVILLISHTKTLSESKFPDEGPAWQKHITTQCWVSFTPTCVYLHILILQLIVYILRNIPQRFKFTGL
jgi:hypothetical protein